MPLHVSSTCARKNVEAWNKLIVKQKFCASSWLITEINSLVMFVSPSVRKEQLGSHWTDLHEIWYLKIFPKNVETIED